MPKDSTDDNEIARVSELALRFRNEPEKVFRSREKWDESKASSLSESPIAESIAVDARNEINVYEAIINLLFL